MAKAIFNRVFHWNNPKLGFGFSASPKPEAQNFPEAFIAAAVKAGAATRVSSKAKKATKGQETKKS